MTSTYKIHPAIGVARLGNSPEEFCISPEKPAALPIACDAQGNPLLSPDGKSERTVSKFKDSQGRIKRQAARFQIWVYDDESPEGRRLRIGDTIKGGGNAGVLVDIQWRVYLANKKASWYSFEQLEGEHGYAPNHPRRNADITDPAARQRLVIDPGPRFVNCNDRRSACFDRDGDGIYATTFPPEQLTPCSIDTLGELKTDSEGRLLVLGGHGHSGTYLLDEFGQPRIDDYANNDGWFDDSSDGPVTARLVMFSELVGEVRFVDVEYPAWVVAAYPAYVPQILDMVTTDDILYDMNVRQFATRTDLYGEAGTWGDPQHIDPSDREALVLWKAGRLEWKPDYKPWFYRDIWPILFRPDEFTYLSNILAQSNFPHNQSPRGSFDPNRLGAPPVVDHEAVERCEKRCMEQNYQGILFSGALADHLTALEKQTTLHLRRALTEKDDRERVTSFQSSLDASLLTALEKAVAKFARAAHEEPRGSYDRYLGLWRRTYEEASPDYAKAREALEEEVEQILKRASSQSGDKPSKRRAAKRRDDDPVEAMIGEVFSSLRHAVRDRLRLLYTGQLLKRCRAKCIAQHTSDPNRPYRAYLFDLIRRSGEENDFKLLSKAASRTHNLPLMPLLTGDNPISNTLPSKFLRLTDYQYYLLRQWARGLFYNEEHEGWAKPDPWMPYASWENRTGRDLDRGVLSNMLGGAFCPGGEVGWVQRNPSVYLEPYRLKVDPGFSAFRLTAAQACANKGQVPEVDYGAYTETDLSQDNNYDRGLQPGDLTKSMAIPWQADFNECTTQPIDVTYESWNKIYPKSDSDSLLKRQQQAWETLWWPAHRPLQVFMPPYDRTVDWARGIPGTLAGDLAMVTQWWQLPFVLQNPQLAEPIEPSEQPPDPIKYIGVERSQEED